MEPLGPSCSALRCIAVAGVGEVNGDGAADILVGAPGEGVVQIYYGNLGKTKSFDSTVDVTFTGTIADAFGFSVASAQDRLGRRYAAPKV